MPKFHSVIDFFADRNHKKLKKLIQAYEPLYIREIEIENICQRHYGERKREYRILASLLNPKFNEKTYAYYNIVQKRPIFHCGWNYRIFKWCEKDCEFKDITDFFNDNIMAEMIMYIGTNSTICKEEAL